MGCCRVVVLPKVAAATILEGVTDWPFDPSTNPPIHNSIAREKPLKPQPLSILSLSDHDAHLLHPIGHYVHILTLRATTRSEGEALVSVVGLLLAFAVVARHAAGVVEGLARLAGDVGAHVPGGGAGEEGEVAEVGDLERLLISGSVDGEGEIGVWIRSAFKIGLSKKIEVSLRVSATRSPQRRWRRFWSCLGSACARCN